MIDPQIFFGLAILAIAAAGIFGLSIWAIVITINGEHGELRRARRRRRDRRRRHAAFMRRIHAA